MQRRKVAAYESVKLMHQTVLPCGFGGEKHHLAVLDHNLDEMIAYIVYAGEASYR